MFSIKDNAITPHLGRFQEATRRLPTAHVKAQRAGVDYLHGHVRQAANDAGVDASPLTVVWHEGQARLGIEHSEEGNQLADMEYGTPDTAPNPVLRTAQTTHMPQAQAHFAHALVRELGF